MLMLLIGMLLITIIILRKFDIMELRIKNEGTHKFDKKTCTIFDTLKKR